MEGGREAKNNNDPSPLVPGKHTFFAASPPPSPSFLPLARLFFGPSNSLAETHKPMDGAGGRTNLFPFLLRLSVFLRGVSYFRLPLFFSLWSIGPAAGGILSHGSTRVGAASPATAFSAAFFFFFADLGLADVFRSFCGAEGEIISKLGHIPKQKLILGPIKGDGEGY